MAPVDDHMIVTFTPDKDGYGTVSCNWEDEPRKVRIADWAASNFALGWNAELVVKGAW